MPNATDRIRQYDPNLCPRWCTGEHLFAAPAEDFHHDAATRQVLPELGALAGNALPIAVGTSQFEPADGLGPRPPRVELHVGGAVSVLSREEAVEIATALLLAAEQTLQEAQPGVGVGRRCPARG